MSTMTASDAARRPVPPLGGLNLTLVGIELRRTLRNRRTLFFALLFPTAMYFVIALSNSGMDDKAGNGNVAAYIMVSMALYGGALTAAAGGAMVAMERALGWSRQLRLTPLSAVSYIVVKVIAAMVMGAVAIAVVNLAARIQGLAKMPATDWIACAVLTLICALVFAALGLFVGYLLPGENAMQILGPGMALLSFLGDVFIPITHGSTLWHIAAFTPMFGVAQISRAPMTHFLPWYAVANAIFWFAVFVAGAAWRMSRDTARV